MQAVQLQYVGLQEPDYVLIQCNAFRHNNHITAILLAYNTQGL